MKYVLTIFVLLLCVNAFSTEVVIPKNQDGGWYYPNVSGIHPGDTIIVTGDYAYAYLDGLHGTAAQKITIRTKTTATFGTNGAYALIFPNCSYLIIDGINNQGAPYSISFGNTNGSVYTSQTLTPNNSTNYEIRYVNVTKGEVGIFLNPVLGADKDSVWIHHNHIFDMRGTSSCEAMYIGNTSKLDTTPPMIRHLIVEYNTCWNLGGDGIQVCCAPGFIIRYNTVTNFGVQRLGTHCTGLLLGGNANGNASYNTITTGSGSGSQVLGYGTVTLSYCTFTGTATNPLEQPDAIYISKRGGIGSAKLQVNMDHVTVTGASRYGVNNDGNNTIGGTWNCMDVTGFGYAAYHTNGDIITNVNCNPTPPSGCSGCYISNKIFINN